MSAATGEPVDLDAIRARCEAATPGPWKLEMEERYETGEKDAPYVYSADGSTCICSGQTYYPQQVTAANAAFIAAARSDIPALLASHAALEQRVAGADKEAEDRWHHLLTEAERRIKELEEDLANATGGFDAAMELADAEQERAKAAEQRVRDLEGALRDVRHRLMTIPDRPGPNSLDIIDAALRGTGEGK